MAAIGIDLGTTNTAIAAVVDGVAVTLEDEKGRRLLPSIVSFHASGNVLVGHNAKERRLNDPANTIYSTKRMIGRAFSSPEVQSHVGKFPYKLVAGVKDTTMVEARGVQYALPEISAFVLRRAKAIAEAALNETVDKAVITVPANFNDLQRASTKVAGKLAGLEVLRILNEPTAAALAYGQSVRQAERVAVYDLGGGTFDITLLDLSGSVFEVLSTAGDTSLGGDDVDTLVADKIAEEILRAHRYDPRRDSYSYGTLRIIGEFVKQQLSNMDEVTFEVRDIGPAMKGEMSHVFRMTRAELEALARPLVQRTLDVTAESVQRAGLSAKAFDSVILVGGSTRMPLVSRMVSDYFGKAPELRVNPDEVVALGAAIQAGVLRGEVKDVLLLDVTPLSLGIETKGGVMTKLIERNTTIPTRKSEVFSTAEDGQTSVEIHVLQGEREMASFNKTLGKFQLVGIPPAPRGVPQVEVTFDIDANGILNVSAKDRGTGNEQQIRIEGGSGLADDEIQRMVRDAETHADDDRRAKELAEARNEAEQAIYQTEKALKDHGDKVDADTRSTIEGAVGTLRSTLESGDAGTIRQGTQALREASFKLSEALYQQAGQAGGAQGSSSSSSPDEEVIEDAEIVDPDGTRA